MRSYQSDANFPRKAEAKAQVCERAIQHDALKFIAEGESKISGHLALLENEGKVDDRILATDPGVKAIEDWCEESKLLIKWYDTTAKDGERKSVQIFPVASLILSCSSWCCSPDPCDFAFIPCILHRRAV